jgi:hypothetical protein
METLTENLNIQYPTRNFQGRRKEKERPLHPRILANPLRPQKQFEIRSAHG